MRKTFKKGIALVLALVMLASVSLGIFAEEPEYEQFDSIFSIGDSNLMGYGLKGYKGNPSETFDYPEKNNYSMYSDGHEIWLDGGPEGSFPYEVMTALGLSREDACNLNCPGLRAKDALWLLNGDVSMEGDKFFATSQEEREKQILQGGTTKTTPDIGVRDNDEENFFVQNLKEKKGDKKLVLLYAGASDVFFSTMSTVILDVLADGGLDGFSLGDIDLLEVVNVVVKTFWDNYNEFLKVTPKLIERVRELNPSAKLMVIGTFNPVKDLKISDESALPIFDAMATISNLMNDSYRRWAKEYDAVYVDIANVETRTLEYGITLSNVFKVNMEWVYHATSEGYKYIARQILNKVKTDDSPARDLVIDLGSVKEINSVMLGGLPIKKYSFIPATHTLTIPNGGLFPHGTMTVTEERVVNEETGETQRFLASYTLQWDFTNREWTAYRIYATMDAGGAYSLFTGLIVAFWRSFISLFKKK